MSFYDFTSPLLALFLSLGVAAFLMFFLGLKAKKWEASAWGLSLFLGWTAFAFYFGGMQHHANGFAWCAIAVFALYWTARFLAWYWEQCREIARALTEPI